MAIAPFYDRVLETSTTTGTGTLTLGGAVTGYQTFAVIGNSNTTPMAIWEVDADGNPSGAWEVAHVCTYTAAGTTLTRGTLLASSTGSAINFGAGTKHVGQVLPAAILKGLSTASQTYIAGLIVTKTAAANTIDITAGSCYDPSSQKIITYAGATGVNAGTLGASQWNQVYLYDNAGTPTIEVTNNAAPPTTAYAGTARQGGTNSNRRWIGSFRTTSGSAIEPQEVRELGGGALGVTWQTDPDASPQRVVSNGTSVGSFTQVSLVGCVPRYVPTGVLLQSVITGDTTSPIPQTVYSLDGTINIYTHAAEVATASPGYDSNALKCAVEAGTPSIYYKTINGCHLYLGVVAYEASR